MEKFIFGIFDKGKLIITIGNTIKCDIMQADLIARILDKADWSWLPNGHYFAYDYAKSHKTT